MLSPLRSDAATDWPRRGWKGSARGGAGFRSIHGKTAAASAARNDRARREDTAESKRRSRRAGGDPMDGTLLEVIDLHVRINTPRGVVRAVDGVSLRLEKERTLGVVGESGAGKTVLIRSIMGLLPPRNVDRSGQILFQGQDLLRLRSRDLESIWGKEIAMIFQDPMTALNPVVRLGRQITETVRCHTNVSRRRADESRNHCLRRFEFPSRPESCVRIHTSCPGACDNGF